MRVPWWAMFVFVASCSSEAPRERDAARAVQRVSVTCACRGRDVACTIVVDGAGQLTHRYEGGRFTTPSSGTSPHYVTRWSGAGERTVVERTASETHPGGLRLHVLEPVEAVSNSVSCGASSPTIE